MTTDYCDSNPCQHDGTCFSKQSTYNCICSEGYTGNECQDSKREREGKSGREKEILNTRD